MISVLERVARRGLRLSLLIFSLPVVGLTASNEPFAGVDDKWHHYQSPHFELFSRVSDDDSRIVLRELEVMRALFLKTLDLEARSPAPVTIYHFGNARDFRTYLPEAHRKNDTYRAYYLPDPDRGVMLLAPLDDTRSGNFLALSSYVHHLFRMAGENAPVWFESGFAHLFETLEVQSERVFFGRSQPGRVQLLQRQKLMPLANLMGVDHADPLFGDESATQLFFAQSWAVMHYWMLGQHQIPRERIDRFLKEIRLRPGISAEERRRLFEQCFGMSLEKMNVAIDSYVMSGRYSFAKIPIPELPDRSSYIRRDVPRDEIRLRLGELAYRATESPAGRLALLEAIGKDQNDVRSLEALGAMARRRRDREEFHDRWERAIVAGTTNPAVVCQFAEQETERWFRQVDYYFRLPAERADYLRELLMRSIKCAPQQTEAYELLAWVESSAPEPSIANVNLVQQKFPTLRKRARTLLALALIRLRLGDRENGEHLLASVEQVEGGANLAQAVENIRAALENRPPRRLPASAPSPTERVPVPLRLERS